MLFIEMSTLFLFTVASATKADAPSATLDNEEESGLDEVSLDRGKFTKCLLSANIFVILKLEFFFFGILS